MAIVFKLLQDGAFVVGNTETRHTGYACSTSPHATQARHKPALVAAEMAKGLHLGRSPLSPQHLARIAEYDARNWEDLGD